MTAISSAFSGRTPAGGGIPLLGGMRRGVRAFAREVASSVPLLQRPRARRQESPQSVRLTRRGRILLVGLPVMLGALASAALLLLLLAPSYASAGTDPLQGPGLESVTVQPGQSLWQVADQAQPERDQRAVVAEIVELNDLDSSSIVAGQRILVPAA